MADYDDIDDMDFLPEDMQVSAPTGNAGGSSSSSFASAGGFLCLYPIYYDADRSTTNGRVVSADLAFKGVTVWHVGEAVKRLGLPCIIEETKRHPRDPLTMGRVRTVLKQDGHTFNRKVTNRRQLHKEIARLLPSVSEQVAVLLEERKQAELDEMKRMQAMMPPGMAGMGGMMNPLAGMLGGMGLEESQDGDAGATTKAADKKKKDKKKR
ncbi:signal recognition particle subunit [Sorochytrium milnesiophthora]